MARLAVDCGADRHAGYVHHACPPAVNASMPLPRENLEHECFRQPKDPATPVWRYMDLTKLISIVLRDQLTLSRLDTLPDKFEGLHGRHFERRFREEMTANLTDSATSGLELQTTDEAAANIARHAIEFAQQIRRISYVSCWRMGANESEAMWRIYGSAPSSVAIMLPYQRLRDSLDDASLFIGMINYFDYERDLAPGSNLYGPIMSKRHEFDFEKEVRIARARVELYNSNGPDPLATLPKVETIPWDTAGTIERIVVSPYTPRWQSDTIREIVQRLSPALAERIVESEMGMDPF